MNAWITENLSQYIQSRHISPKELRLTLFWVVEASTDRTGGGVDINSKSVTICVVRP